MAKDEVLTQVYPDELDYIFQRKRERDIQRYYGYLHQLKAISAGFGAKTEDGRSLYEVYSRQLIDIIDQLENAGKPEKEVTEEDLDQALDRLKGLQGFISQTKARKKR